MKAEQMTEYEVAVNRFFKKERDSSLCVLVSVCMYIYIYLNIYV